MAIRSNRSRFKTGNPSLRLNNAPSATPRTSTCTTTTGKNAHSCFVKFAHRPFRPIIVIKEPPKPNITVHIATERFTAGKSVWTSLCTNAATIIARIDSTRSNNSTPQKKISDNQNLHNSNSVTFTANTCSRLKISQSPPRSNQPSTSAKSTIRPTSSG